VLQVLGGLLCVVNAESEHVEDVGSVVSVCCWI